MLTLVANGAPPALPFLQKLTQKSEGLVAIDGGLVTCDQAGLEPDLIFGDLDSAPAHLLKKYSHVPQIEAPDQNKTDLEKAITYLCNIYFESFTICGALGKRIDHTLLNLFLLAQHPDKIKFESEKECCFALPKTSELKCIKGQTLSLMPISSRVTGVTTSGLKWELNKATLNKKFVSLSNVCLQEKLTITFETGDLLIILEK